MTDGRINDLGELESFVLGNIHTRGRTDAALAAATVCRLARASDPHGWEEVLAKLDVEVDARITNDVLRRASRRLGRQLTRVAARCWPHAVFGAIERSRMTMPLGPHDAGHHHRGLHQVVVLGVCTFAAGAGTYDAAALALHHAVATPIQAALRIGGLDPFALAAMSARLGTAADDLAREAADDASRPLNLLPCPSAPLAEISATHHADLPTRLFAT